MGLERRRTAEGGGTKVGEGHALPRQRGGSHRTRPCWEGRGVSATGTHRRCLLLLLQPLQPLQPGLEDARSRVWIESEKWVEIKLRLSG